MMAGRNGIRSEIFGAASDANVIGPAMAWPVATGGACRFAKQFAPVRTTRSGSMLLRLQLH